MAWVVASSTLIQQITGHKSLGSLGHYLQADDSEVLAAIMGG